MLWSQSTSEFASFPSKMFTSGKNRYYPSILVAQVILFVIIYFQKSRSSVCHTLSIRPKTDSIDRYWSTNQIYSYAVKPIEQSSKFAPFPWKMLACGKNRYYPSVLIWYWLIDWFRSRSFSVKPVKCSPYSWHPHKNRYYRLVGAIFMLWVMKATNFVCTHARTDRRWC